MVATAVEVPEWNKEERGTFMNENRTGAEDWLTAEIGASAQQALDEPERLDVRVDALWRTVRDARSPKLAARSAHTMVLVVLYHLVSLTLMRDTLPLHRHPASLVVGEEHGERYLRNGYRRYLGTPYAPVLVSGLHWYLQATQKVLSELGDGPAHPYRLLPEQISLRVREYRGDGQEFDPDSQWAASMEDVQILLQLLVARQRACSHEPDAGELYRMVVSEVEVMSRGTSTARKKIRRIIPRGPGFTPEQVPLEEWPDESTTEDMFAAHDRVFVETHHPRANWRDERLDHGPANGPWFCSGAYALRPRDHGSHELAREYFEVHAERAGVANALPSDGRFMIVAPLLLNMAAIAAETIWA